MTTYAPEPLIAASAVAEWQQLEEPYSRYLLISEGMSESTVETYILSARLLAQWCERERVSLIGLSAEEYGHHFSENRLRMARSTMRARLFAHRSFFKYLIAAGHRDADDPTAHIKVKLEKRLPEAPHTEQELARLLAGCTAERFQELTLRNRALLLLFIGSGARRAEILSLTTDDIDFERDIIDVHGKGAKRRTLAPGTTAMEALRLYLGDRTGHVFLSHAGRPLSRTGAQTALKHIARRAGVKGVHWHRFRHTFAHHFLKQSNDLETLRLTLGHATWDMVAHYVAFAAHERALEQQRSFSLADRISAEAHSTFVAGFDELRDLGELKLTRLANRVVRKVAANPGITHKRLRYFAGSTGAPVLRSLVTAMMKRGDLVLEGNGYYVNGAVPAVTAAGGGE